MGQKKEGMKRRKLDTRNSQRKTRTETSKWMCTHTYKEKIKRANQDDSPGGRKSRNDGKKEREKREGIEPIKRRSSNQLKLSLSFNYREMTTQ